MLPINAQKIILNTFLFLARHSNINTVIIIADLHLNTYGTLPSRWTCLPLQYPPHPPPHSLQPLAPPPLGWVPPTVQA